MFLSCNQVRPKKRPPNVQKRLEAATVGGWCWLQIRCNLIRPHTTRYDLIRTFGGWCWCYNLSATRYDLIRPHTDVWRLVLVLQPICNQERAIYYIMYIRYTRYRTSQFLQFWRPWGLFFCALYVIHHIIKSRKNQGCKGAYIIYIR